MKTDESLDELVTILQDLLEKEELCNRGLLQDVELDSLYETIPQNLERLVQPLNELSNRIYIKQLQIHNATTRFRKQKQTNIASPADFESLIKPWGNCIEDILEVYQEQSELRIELEWNRFDWLDSYPSIKSDIKDIQKKIDNKVLGRATMDDIRLVIENFLQSFLNNKKPLEKQFDRKNDSPLKRELKKRKVETEKITWIEDVLFSFANYQNTYVKHQKESKSFSYPDVEFSYLQVGAIMKYLTSL